MLERERGDDVSCGEGDDVKFGGSISGAVGVGVYSHSTGFWHMVYHLYAHGCKSFLSMMRG